MLAPMPQQRARFRWGVSSREPTPQCRETPASLAIPPTCAPPKTQKGTPPCRSTKRMRLIFEDIL